MYSPLQYTANFSTHGIVGERILFNECRVMVGQSPCNYQVLTHENDQQRTHFTLTEVIEDGVNPEEYFENIAKDLERYLGVNVTVHELILDD